MVGSMIILLGCIGYILNEARQAPIIEDDESDDASEAPLDVSDANHPEPPTGSGRKPSNHSRDQ